MANILLWLSSGNTSLKILRPDYTKRNTEIDTTVIRGSESYRCATEKKEELGIFWTVKQSNH